MLDSGDRVIPEALCLQRTVVPPERSDEEPVMSDALPPTSLTGHGETACPRSSTTSTNNLIRHDRMSGKAR